MLEEDGFLCGLYFEDQGLSYEGYAYQKDLAVFEKSEKWLKDYFDGRIPEEVPPLRLKGKQFQKDVCQALMKIPYDCQAQGDQKDVRAGDRPGGREEQNPSSGALSPLDRKRWFFDRLCGRNRAEAVASGT